MLNYGKPNYLGDGLTAALGDTELDLLVIDNQEMLTESQLGVYINLSAIGSNTTVNIKYYCRFEVGGDWYELPYRNEGTGVLSSLPTELTAAAKFIDSLPLPPCLAFKVTAIGDNAADDGAIAVTLLGRNN